MANLKISQLTPGNPAQSGDVIPIERSDVNFSITAGSIAALATAGVTSVGFEGDGTVLSSVESGPVTGSGILSATLNTQSANLVLAGPATGSAATPTFRSLVLADLPSIPWSSLANPAGNLTLSMGTDTTTFNQTSNTPWLWANTTTSTSSTTNASPLLELAANYWTGSASAQDLWTLGSALGAGTNGKSILSLTHSGSTGNAYLATNAITTSSGAGLTLDVNGNGGQINFTQQRGATSVGTLTFGSGGGIEGISLNASTQGGTVGMQANFTTQSSATSGSSGILQHFGNNASSLTATSGTVVGVDIGSSGGGVTGDLSLGMTFAPTSTSSAIVNGLRIAPTINVGAAVSWTGSATMLLVNPTLTATGSGTPTINLMDLQVGGVSRFTVNQNGHINNSTTDVSGSVSSAPTGIVATNVVVAVGAATATFTVSSTEGFTVGDTVTASASGWTAGSGIASSTATVTSVTNTTTMVLTRATGGPWVAGTYTAQTGTLAQTGGTSVSVIYATAYTSTPSVVVTPTSNAGAFYISASSTTGFTITYASSGTQTFNYHVMGNPS